MYIYIYVLVSFLDGLFSGAMSVSGRVNPEHNRFQWGTLFEALEDGMCFFHDVVLLA